MFGRNQASQAATPTTALLPLNNHSLVFLPTALAALSSPTLLAAPPPAGPDIPAGPVRSPTRWRLISHPWPPLRRPSRRRSSAIPPNRRPMPPRLCCRGRATRCASAAAGVVLDSRFHRFNIYIYDYCHKRGFKKTARELLAEADIAPESTPPINARQGLLFESVLLQL